MSTPDPAVNYPSNVEVHAKTYRWAYMLMLLSVYLVTLPSWAWVGGLISGLAAVSAAKSYGRQRGIKSMPTHSYLLFYSAFSAVLAAFGALMGTTENNGAKLVSAGMLLAMGLVTKFFYDRKKRNEDNTPLVSDAD